MRTPAFTRQSRAAARSGGASARAVTTKTRTKTTD